MTSRVRLQQPPVAGRGAVRTIACLVLAAATMVVTLSGPAVAQELPLTPDPALCGAEPVEIGDLMELAAGEVERAADDSSELPAADPVVIAEITGVVIGATACTNANQPLRTFSFFTDRYLAQLFGEDTALLGHLDVATTRDPDVAPEDERLTVERIDNVRSGDNVAIATVTTSNRATRFMDELTFRLVEGEWLIDAAEPIERTEMNRATSGGA